MAELFSMKNRVVLLTGASRGLGRDMALTLGSAGATVLCAGRTVKELEKTQGRQGPCRAARYHG
jgi:NAD(P)-dependent dehydrogenase (short-subunit alcohol dehydrogenase family)